MADSSILTSLPPSSDGSGSKGKAKGTPLDLQPGMENGYTLSPMGMLRLEYNRDSETESSLFTRSKLLISKKNLEISDILDRSLNKLNASIPRFCLEIGMGLWIDSTVKDMQNLMWKAISLIEWRSSHFLVDPHSLLMGTLRGAGSLEELNIAWAALTTRMELAQEYFEKYDTEYRAEFKEDLLLSPVSTNAEVYTRIPSLRTNMERLTPLYKEVPHHGVALDADFPAAQSPYLPDWIPAPTELKEVFPMREPELRPLMIYYNAESGERIERAPPPRSSRGAGKDFQPPNDYRQEDRSGRPYRQNSSCRDRRAHTGDFLESVREESTQDNEKSRTMVGQNEYSSSWAAGQLAMLGADTPYQSSSDFFVPRSPSDAGRSVQVDPQAEAVQMGLPAAEALEDLRVGAVLEDRSAGATEDLAAMALPPVGAAVLRVRQEEQLKVSLRHTARWCRPSSLSSKSTTFQNGMVHTLPQSTTSGRSVSLRLWEDGYLRC
ncbi:hypothetical protein C8J57DRAFT_1611987 [Mycena rebaudengoi]|nr:hypothetical protein C8J57DRAFT_1611987 [Mycena rebaudengoi]